MKKRTNLITTFTVIALCIVTSIIIYMLFFNKGGFDFKGESGNSMANTVFGGNYSAYKEGFVYYYGQDGVYEYDLETKKAVRIVEGVFSDINVVNKGLILVDQSSDRRVVFYDFYGKELDGISLINDGNYLSMILADDNFIYYRDDKAGMGRINVKSKKHENICESSHSQNISGEYVYFVSEMNSQVIKRMSKQDVSHVEQMDLGFEIIQMVVMDEEVIWVRDDSDYQYHIKWNGEIRKIENVQGYNPTLIYKDKYLYIKDGRLYQSPINDMENEELLIDQYDVDEYCVFDDCLIFDYWIHKTPEGKPQPPSRGKAVFDMSGREVTELPKKIGGMDGGNGN